MDKNTEQKVARLQLLEQNMQNFAMQKQQFQAQIFDIDSAIEELKDSEESFKIVGNIMVKADKEKLEKELKEKKGMLELRINTIEKQEKQLKDKSKELQKEVLDNIKE